MNAPRRIFFRCGRLVAVGAAGLAGYLGLEAYLQHRREQHHTSLVAELSPEERRRALEWRPPPRQHLLNRLRGLSEDGGRALAPEEALFDLLIIGGGATGTGCAIDGAARGLRVALVERDDFSSGTSSKSTKLVHGGVRYLEKAILGLDWEQYAMVKEALAERSTFLRLAPHLTEQLPIMVPIYRWWKVPYFWAGSKAYDLVAGGRGLESSHFINRNQALAAFPMLRKEALVGAMVYYDGAQNDARTNVALALTALQQGATVTNHTEVVELLKEDLGDGRPPQVRGVIVRDRISGQTFPVRCRGVISATGPFCDLIRKMDDPQCQPLVQPSVGTHIVFPSYFSPAKMGLIDPSSSDGRVIFFLPWEGNTLAGTTGKTGDVLSADPLTPPLDAPSELTFEPKASKREVDFIVEEVARYLDPTVQVRSSDVLAAWAGLRPLIRNPKATSTQELVRNHLILQSPSGLLTITGGKWTTYRQMAADTIDAAIEQFQLRPRLAQSPTERIPLIGSHGWEENMYIKLVQRFGLETDVATHLARSYGDRAFIVAAMSPATGKRWPLFGKKLIPWYPYLESEVLYAVRFEYARTAVDVLARRTRLAHQSCRAAQDALPRVVALMAGELGWSPAECDRQTQLALQYLQTCGSEELHPARCSLSPSHMERYRRIYQECLSAREKDQWGRLPNLTAVMAWRRVVEEEGLGDRAWSWTKILHQVDPEGVGSIGFAEFLDGISLLHSLGSQGGRPETS